MQQTTVPAEIPRDRHAAALAELNALVDRANQVKVTNADEYQAAVEICGRIKATRQRREEERLAITRKMDEAKNAVMTFFRSTFLEPLDKVDEILRGKLKAYDAEQRKIADANRRAAELAAQREREEAARKAREAREAAERKAQAERAEAERKRQEAEDARKKAEAAKAAGDAAAAQAAAAAARQLEQAAAKSEQKADTIATRAEEKAQALEDHAASIVAPQITTAPVKAKGVGRRTVWKHRVVDPAKVSPAFHTIDEEKIAKIVKSLGKDAIAVVGGIEVWDEADISIRAVT